MQKPPNPFGSCFEGVGQQILEVPPPFPNVRVCHGIGLANVPWQMGQPIAHAWIEFDHPDRQEIRLAADPVWLKLIEASDYREQMQCSYSVEYLPEEFLANWEQFDYPGPWDRKILDVLRGPA